MDHLIYYVCPENWILDFDCLLSGMSPEDHFLARLMLTIFMPPLLMVINVVLIWFLTFFIKFCQFRDKKHMKPLNCHRLGNRVLVAMSMQMFFLYPSILYILFATTHCYDSLDEATTNEELRRMQIVPEVSCESEWYRNVYWCAIIPAICVYLVIIPLLCIRALVINSHWIFHSGRDDGYLDDEEMVKSTDSKSAFGFFFVGLTISSNLGRPLEEGDFPIENHGTTDPNLKKSTFKICCQWARESFIAVIYQPIASRGALVRINKTDVAKSFFYWEFIVFLEKFILIILCT